MLAEQRGDAYANADVRVSLEGKIPIWIIWIIRWSFIRLDYSFVPSSSGLTHLCLAFAEIASKQGHHDVSKLTPTDIAIEVSLPRIPFLFPVSTYHQTAF